MKIVVYDKNTKKQDINTWGYGKLVKVTSCKIIEELNGRYELEMVVDNSDSKAKYLTKWAIVRADNQLFRISNIVKNDKSFSIKVYGKHISYDLDYLFIEDRKFIDATMNGIMEGIITDDFKDFSFSSSITAIKNLYLVKESGTSSLFRILERWGYGELIRDNYRISIESEKGKDNGVSFTYKKIEEIEVTEDYDEVITQLYPTGFDGIKLPERYIQIPNWNTEDFLPYHITREVYFEEAKDEGTLRALAKAYAENIGLARTNFKINVHDLKNTYLYKEMPQLMSVEVGDTVTIRHEHMDIRIKVKVIKKDIDLIKKTCVLELGQPLQSFFKSIDNSNVRVEIPNIDKYADGLFYYSNGVKSEIANISKSLAFMNFSVEENSNLMTHFSGNVYAKDGGELRFEILVNNSPIKYSPKVTLMNGYTMVSFSFPIISVPANKSHSLDIKVACDREASIDVEGLQVIIRGQKTLGGMSSETPHYEHETKIPYINIYEYGGVESNIEVLFEEVKGLSVIEYISDIEIPTQNGMINETYSVELKRIGDQYDFNLHSLTDFRRKNLTLIGNKVTPDTTCSYELFTLPDSGEEIDGDTYKIYTCTIDNIDDIRSLQSVKGGE